MLFSAEQASCITADGFGKPWGRGDYIRTDCFRSAAGTAALGGADCAAPRAINAKSCHLTVRYHTSMSDSRRMLLDLSGHAAT